MGSTQSAGFNGSIAGVTYGLTMPSAGSVIHASDFTAMVNALNAESIRRDRGTWGLVTPSGTVTASFFTGIASHTAGWTGGNGASTNGEGSPGNASTIAEITGAYTGFSIGLGSIAPGGPIKSADMVSIANTINTAGAVCLCNCNYCTCNCNYCTCNCNYACTCHCNYSDERLKENIKLISTQDGLNVYSFTYLWDKTKTYIGAMAQELLSTQYANAVSIDKNGYYYVDYSQLPIIFKEV
jgi:hypothetical protein